MAITHSTPLNSALYSQTTKAGWCATYTNAMGATRQVRITKNGVTQRSCTLSGTMNDNGTAITSFGVTSADTGSATACDFTDGATWRLIVEGGIGYNMSTTWDLGNSGTTATLANLAANQGFGFLSSFALGAPTTLS